MAIDRVSLVKEWLKAAEPTAAKIGCSPAAIVAQAVLETGWGRAAIGNNLFGIKANASWKGKRQLVPTREVINGQDVFIKDWFRDYDTPAESFADHFEFLSRNSRYTAAGVFDPDDTKSDRQYFEALQRAGYATDPNYANALMNVRESVLSLAGIQQPDAPAMPLYLAIGDRGPDVRKLQSALNTKFGAMLDEDGDFGSTTMLATRHFQKANGLQVDGVAGPKTQKALGLA